MHNRRCYIVEERDQNKESHSGVENLIKWVIFGVYTIFPNASEMSVSMVVGGLGTPLMK